MKNLFKKEETTLDFGSLSTILTSSTAAGITVAKFTGKDTKTAGMIGVGLSSLVTRLIVAMEEDDSKHKINNN